MKKQNVAINSRDKNLLVILIAIIIGFLCYTYIINPQLAITTELKMESEIVQAELQRAKTAIANLPALENEEKQLKVNLSEKYKPFFSELNQERILYRLDTLMQESGLPVVSYNPERIRVSNISVEKGQYEPLNYSLLDHASIVNPALKENNENDDSSQSTAGNDNGVSTDAVPTVDILLDITGATYPSVFSFIQKVESMEKTIIIKSIELSRSEVNLDGQVALSLYALPKLNDAEKEYLKFMPNAAFGKDIPF